MNTDDAVNLIRDAVAGSRGVWADLGSGDGLFTRALFTLIGPKGRIYAVDSDPRALVGLRRWARSEAPTVVAVLADFSRPFDLPGLNGTPLDGILLANSLHFVSDPAPVLAGLVARLRPGGRVVLVEYDRRQGSPWVPHPIPAGHLTELAAQAGLLPPEITATRPSVFGGRLYAAAAVRPAPDGAKPPR